MGWDRIIFAGHDIYCLSSIYHLYHFLLHSDFTFLLSCCDIRGNFHIINIFGSSLPPVVCSRAHVLYTLFVFACAQWCPKHLLYEQHGGCLIRCRKDFPFARSWVHLQCVVRSVLLIILCFLLCLSSSCVICIQCCPFLWIVNSWCGWQFNLF